MRSAGSRSWRSTPIARPPGSGGCPSSGPAGPGGGRCARSARASRRSGEGRGGEEGRTRGAPGHLKKKKRTMTVSSDTFAYQMLRKYYCLIFERTPKVSLGPGAEVARNTMTFARYVYGVISIARMKM